MSMNSCLSCLPVFVQLQFGFTLVCLGRVSGLKTTKKYSSSMNLVAPWEINVGDHSSHG